MINDKIIIQSESKAPNKLIISDVMFVIFNQKWLPKS
jgi:hypothetical protein